MFLFYSADVIRILDEVIKVVDEDRSVEDLTQMSTETAALPHIEHWNHLVTLLRDRTVAAAIILPRLLGVSALAILAAVMLTPVYLSLRVYGCVSESHLFVSMVILTWIMSRYFKQLLSPNQDTRFLGDLRHSRTAQGEHQGMTDPDSHDGESTPGGQGVETMHSEGGGDARTSNATSQG